MSFATSILTQGPGAFSIFIFSYKDFTLRRLIVSITTYGEKLTDRTDEPTINRITSIIRELILTEFEQRIHIELATLYIKKKKEAEQNSKASIAAGGPTGIQGNYYRMIKR